MGGDTEESFGQMIRRLREARRWSQWDVANRTGLDQSAISQVELDKGKRRASTVERLAEAFGVADTHDWLVMAGVLKARPTPPTPDEAEDDEPDAAQVAAIVAYVEAKPGAHFRRRLARQKSLRSPEAYERLCLRLHRAWTANGDLALDAIEMAEQ